MTLTEALQKIKDEATNSLRLLLDDSRLRNFSVEAQVGILGLNLNDRAVDIDKLIKVIEMQDLVIDGACNCFGFAVGGCYWCKVQAKALELLK